MDLTADDLAGVVDLFGGLTREELERALAEAAYRADGGTVDEDVLAERIDEAIEAFALVRCDAGRVAAADSPDDGSADGASAATGDGPAATGDESGTVGDGSAGTGGPSGTSDAEPLLVAGPTAFPRVPDGAEDVPHILDIDRRRIDREALGRTVRDRFAEAVAAALGEGRDGSGDVDRDRLRHLLEVSYDVESWAPVDVAPERERLEAALEEE